VNSYKGLILDFGGVLTTSVPACAAGFDQREELPHGTFLNAITSNPVGRALYADLERGAITQVEWNERTAALIGIDGTDLLRRVLVDLQPEPTVIDAARRIREAGVKLGIFSNSLGLEPYNPYEPWNLDENYDVVLISELYHLRKPDPEIYLLMMEMMQLTPQDCVFIDDTAHNLPPAEELGMAVILATDPTSTVAQLQDLFRIPLTSK
jgi:putative hydrolase of the HAD superfamily